MSTSSAPSAEPLIRPIRVGSLVMRLAQHVQSVDEFRDLWVEGEVVEARAPSSGHVYFTLRDPVGVLRCTLFATQAMNVALTPRDGMKVLAHGYVEVYPRTGACQLRVDDLRPAGAGEAALRLEALRKRLEAEGLFRADRKKEPPAHPRRIGVVTSPDGAAWRDIQAIVARRDASVELVLAHAAVQGPGAAESMIAALDGLAQLRDLDAVILARGGGASEDLWPFNDEALVRAIARFPRPLVSGVGHESDTTLADHAADLRAPTPSAAVERLVPDASGTRVALARLRQRIDTRVREAADRRRSRLREARRLIERRAPAARVGLLRQRLDEARRAADRAMGRAAAGRRQRLVASRRRLDALSPLAVLGRGYAIVDGPDGRVRTSARSFAEGDAVGIRLRDGRVAATVREVRPS
ncbi:MAG TPA: exodeoxyribonuclease VII large subunit [Candidatus Limnocylindria bacterium]|nr:exodeoxyribonuclease VII large subunit [Candidatus Limnocylindria bacterium]